MGEVAVDKWDRSWGHRGIDDSTILVRADKDSADHVYGIEAGEYIKIGVAKHPPSRISSLQTGCPHEMHLAFAIVGGGPLLEQQLHQHLHNSKVRARGEWFYRDRDVRELIDALKCIERGTQLDSNEQILCVCRLPEHLFMVRSWRTQG